MTAMQISHHMAASACFHRTWLAVGGHHGREQNKVLQHGQAAAGSIQVLRGPRLGRRGSIPPCTSLRTSRSKAEVEE